MHPADTRVSAGGSRLQRLGKSFPLPSFPVTVTLALVRGGVTRARLPELSFFLGQAGGLSSWLSILEEELSPGALFSQALGWATCSPF